MKLFVATMLAVAVVAMPALAQKKAGGAKAGKAGKAAAKMTRLAGTVDDISETALTIKTTGKAAGSTVLTLNAETQYVELADGTTNDLVKDATVYVTVDGEGDAAVGKGVAVYSGKEAERVVGVAALSLAARARGKGAKPAPGDRKNAPKPVIGKVTALDAGKLSVDTKKGAVTVKLATDAIVLKLVDKTRADIAKGRSVVALHGEAKTAAVVVQMPEPKKRGAGRAGAGGGKKKK
jgi:hypothetical protein